MRPATRIRTAVVFVTFVAIVLAGLGFLFRSYLMRETEATAQAALDSDWGAAAAFLRVENKRPQWLYDRNDPNEVYAVERLRHVYLIADDEGNVLENSMIFESISLPQVTKGDYPNRRFLVEHDRAGAPYLVVWGSIRDDRDRKYRLALGRPLLYDSANRFTVLYVAISAVTLVFAGFLGWWTERQQRPTNLAQGS